MQDRWQQGQGKEAGSQSNKKVLSDYLKNLNTHTMETEETALKREVEEAKVIAVEIFLVLINDLKIKISLNSFI